MKEETIQLLKKKGWSEEDIKKAEEIIARRKIHDKSKTFDYANKVLYWAAFGLMVIGNFILSIALIPFLLVLNSWALDIVVICLGFSFGLFFNLIVKDIENISASYHAIAAFGLPFLALGNFFIMTKMANALNQVFQFSTVRENPVSIAAIYTITFILPYFWNFWIKKKYEYPEEEQQ